MRFVVLGTTDFAINCALGLSDGGGEIAAVVSIPEHALPDNSVDIKAFADTIDADYLEIEDVNTPEAKTLIGSYEPDYVFISWPKILRASTLDIPRRFCIGTHAASLPYNRGRHPLHWHIVLGLPYTHLSFFKLDTAIDNGDILSQVRIDIESNDSIEYLGQKVNIAGRRAAKDLCQKLRSEPEFTGVPQTSSEANYWRRRTQDDSTLDFRMSTAAIVRTVRSFSPPFPCAIVRHPDGELRIIAAAPASEIDIGVTAEAIGRMEPGKILAAKGVVLSIKTDDGVVTLTTATSLPDRFEENRYIFPPTRYTKSS